MVYVKYLFVILAPWLAFFIGDEIYGSTHLIFHHPCEQTKYGCLRIDFASFVIKGALFGFLIGSANLSSSQLITSLFSALVLLVLVTVRLGAVQMAGVLSVLQGGHYWLGVYIPVIIGMVLFYSGSKYVSGKL